MFKITGLYASLCAIWLLYLTFYVIKMRYKHQVGLMDNGQKPLTKAIRIHGNATETLPIALILMAMAEVQSPATTWLHICGILLLFSRISHYVGIKKTSGASLPRAVGMATTMTVIAVLACFNIAHYFLFIVKA